MENATAGLRPQGRPQAEDVKLRPAPSAASGVQASLQRDQVPSPQPVPGLQPAQAPQPVQPQNARTKDQVMAMKDKAITDARQERDAIQAKLKEQEIRAQTLQDQLAQATIQRLSVATPQPQPAAKPDNWEELGGEDRARWIAREEAKRASAEQAEATRQAVLAQLGPTMERYSEIGRRMEVDEALKMYPQFPYLELKDQVDRQMAELPGLRVHEAMALVGARSGLHTLQPAEPEAPATMPVVPDASTATVGPGQVTPLQSQQPTYGQVLQKTREAAMSGDRRTALQGKMNLLRRIGLRDRHGNRVPIPGEPQG